LPREDDSVLGYSISHVQGFSGLSRRTLRRLIRSSQLRATKNGRETMIDKQSLERYMHDHGYAEQLRLFE